MKYIRYIAEHVLDELDSVKFTPFFREKFRRLNIPVINFYFKTVIFAVLSFQTVTQLGRGVLFSLKI